MEARQATLPDLIAQAGHSQASFARRLGVGESQVSRWCRGLPPGEKNKRAVVNKLNAELRKNGGADLVTVEELWP